MTKDWILQTKETRRTFSRSTWVPLRASHSVERNEIKEIGYTSEFFGCGSVAFPTENRKVADELSWSQIGIIHNVVPYADESGLYSSIEQYQYDENGPIGVHFVFEHPQPVIGGRRWILNPDMVVALRLVKEGNNWVRPEENFTVVVREEFNEKGEHSLIEIKREFLLDYLTARNLFLRISYYRQRVENVLKLEDSDFAELEDMQEERDGGRFELHVRSLEEVFGGSWASFRVWRTDVDEEEDAPVMEPESDENTEYEKKEGHHSGRDGIRVEGEFWRDESIENNGLSIRVRGDREQTLPQFIVETDGTRMASADLCNEDIGRWLWFDSDIINALLNLRGFSLGWYTSETGGIQSTSGYIIPFGINSSDLITVYAYDIARLDGWEQQIWAAHNVCPDGKVSAELLAAQVKTQPASTRAVESSLFQVMRMLENGFHQILNTTLFSHDIDDTAMVQQIHRFASRDQASLLKLAKELVRVFSDRLNVRELRKLSTHKDKEKMASNKLLQDVLAQKVGADTAYKVFGAIVGAYDMRVGDAHPTSSKIGEAMKLVGIDESLSFMRQGEQLILNYGQSVWWIGKYLFGKPDTQ